jgi:hypothetical protein
MSTLTRHRKALARILGPVSLLIVLIGVYPAGADSTGMPSQSIQGAGFETGDLTGWNKGSQTGTLGAYINGTGTGVSVFNGSRTFTHGPHGAMGSPTVNGQPNKYYAPAVSAGSWTFSPSNNSYAALLQPKNNEATFSAAMSALGLSGSPQTAIQNELIADAQASGNGSPNPTNAAWITKEVELMADVTYTMSWNYVGTDYVPFNDGSITSLVPVTVGSTPVIKVNNYTAQYALLGFTNPGTGDYSVNSYGSTGWQTSTYEVSVTGTYKLGFASFNLGDTGLSPVLMIDDTAGATNRCAADGSNCTTFGGVQPNNETAPAIETTTTTTTSTTTTVPPTTTTTVAPYYNAVTNLTAVANADGSVDLDWDAPASSNLNVYGYSVSFYDLDEIGGTTSGGWGVWTNQGTNYSLSTGMFSGSNPVTTGFGPVRFGIKAGNESCFSNEGVGPCVYGPEVTVDATVLDPASSSTNLPPSTTTSTATTTTTTTTTTVPTGTTTTTTESPVLQTTTTTVPPVVVTLPPTTTVPETTTTVPETTTTAPQTTVPETTTTIPQEPSTTTTTSSPPQKEDAKVVTTTTPTTLPLVDSGEQAKPTQPESPSPKEETKEEALPNNTQQEIILITQNKTVSELTNEDKAKIAAVVTAVIQSGVTQEVAVGLASNAAVLESIDTSQAVAVFEQVSAESLTTEQAEAVVEAVQSAPEAIRGVFEDVVDLFQGAFDNYKMLGQTIDVGQRRTVVAAGLLVASAASLSAGAPSSPVSGGSSPSTNQDTATRRNEEEESESAGEIAGDGLEWIKNISIYKYVNGEKVMNWKSFFKKFAYGIFNMGFTIAGSLVVYLTLSGPIQRIAGISTVLAIVAAMWLHMKEPDSE